MPANTLTAASRFLHVPKARTVVGIHLLPQGGSEGSGWVFTGAAFSVERGGFVLPTRPFVGDDSINDVAQHMAGPHAVLVSESTFRLLLDEYETAYRERQRER